jgi:hypothetical protein
VRLRRFVPLLESAFVTNQVASQRGCSRNFDANGKRSAPFPYGPEKGPLFLRSSFAVVDRSLRLRSNVETGVSLYFTIIASARRRDMPARKAAAPRQPSR